MADGLRYTATPSCTYVPNINYVSQVQAGAARVHAIDPSTMRQDYSTMRQRKKFTRSKTGCLTCRAKKVKCDETKPTCLRCSHGKRECAWPEGASGRKKPTVRRKPTSSVDGTETRPSTAGSSSVSDSPPTHGPIMPSRSGPVDVGTPSMAARRQSDPNVNASVTANDAHRPAVVLDSTSPHGYSTHLNNTHVLPNVPEISSSHTNRLQCLHSYPSHPYSQSHSAPPHITAHSLHSRAAETASSDSQWPSPQLLTSVNPIATYFQAPQERNVVESTLHVVHPVRYL